MSPAERCAHAVAELLESRPEAHLAVSGGSTPRTMFGVLAGLPVNWSGVHIYWVDERVVPPDHADSNYRMTREALLDRVSIAPSNVHRIRGEKAPHEAAREYAASLPERFDLVLMGVGDDAHTASLFPGEPLIADRTGNAAAVWVEKKQMWRITLLPKMLLSAESCFVLATGADKKQALHDVRTLPVDPMTYPAQLVLRLRESVLFTDQTDT